jgi:hypothetical protein
MDRETKEILRGIQKSLNTIASYVEAKEER